MESDEVLRVNRRAAEIYFGQHWQSGTFKFPTAYKFDEPQCSSADISNASTIIIRLLREAIQLNDSGQILRVLSLAEFYLKALKAGSHYRSAAIFCDDLVPLIPASGFEEKSAVVRGLQASSLRMQGEDQRSKLIIIGIANYPFSTSAHQDILVDLALCHKSLSEHDEARDVANRVIKLDKRSRLALHARAILIELEEETPERNEKLVHLELECRKKGAFVVADNIALIRTRNAKPDEIRQILEPIIKAPSEESSFYNRTRAALKLANLSLNSGEDLSESEMLYLVVAYHFLFNERLPGLFEQCHDALWSAFEKQGDITNLLILFRQSSLFWRLRGRDKTEKLYLGKLSRFVDNTISDRLSTLNREAAYYLVRAHTQETPKSAQTVE